MEAGAGAVGRGVAGDAEAAAGLDAAGVERWVDIDEPREGGGQRGEEGEAVAVGDSPHAPPTVREGVVTSDRTRAWGPLPDGRGCVGHLHSPSATRAVFSPSTLIPLETSFASSFVLR